MKENTSRFTQKEEQANAISHFAGVILSVFALIFMLKLSIKEGTVWHVISSFVYGITLILLYLSSTFTHWLKHGKLKETFFTFDQIAIFFLIAGTYTPLAIIALHGTTGWIILGIEWSLAFSGSLYRILKPRKYNTGVNLLFILLYVIMGYLFVVVVHPLYDSMGLAGILWILSGGVFYSGGIFFYKKGKFKYHHLVWHLMVLAGSISHFIGIYFYVLPIRL
jgi:hemolysin III